jgi:hypothetical protein
MNSVKPHRMTPQLPLFLNNDAKTIIDSATQGGTPLETISL